MRAGATVYELLLGLTLLFAPWSRLWNENWLVWRLGGSLGWLQTGVAKGAVAGLGAAFLLTALARMLRIPLVEDEPPGGLESPRGSS